MLLVIPLKATKRMDLKTPLTKWVETSHPHYRGNQLTAEIKRLDSIRADLSKALASSSSHSFSLQNNALQDLIQYHACLVECINHGFPSDARDADVNGTIDANLLFSWNNAFEGYDGCGSGSSASISQKGRAHFTFERSCVLWNVAALHTHIAAQGDWMSKEGRVEVRNSYVLAARILRHLMDTNKHVKESDLIPDFYEDALKMCHSMCLAQGQIPAYEALKARLAEPDATSSTYNLLAKIAQGIANHADDALKFSQALAIKDEPFSKAWGGHLKVLSMLFHARAEFLQSQVERRESHYGNEIGRLTRALKMAREGQEFMKSDGFVKTLGGPSSLGKFPNNLQSLLVNCKQRRKVIVNENDTIYHEQVPDSEKMLKIEGRDMMEYNEKDFTLPIEFMPEGLSRPMFTNIDR